jgi:hypothetical protein
MLELSSADYHASTKCAQQGRLATKGIGCTAPSEWEDGGVIHERLKGVQVPKVTGKESNITKDIIDSRASLQYNEVCYFIYLLSFWRFADNKSSILCMMSLRSKLGICLDVNLVTKLSKPFCYFWHMYIQHLVPLKAVLLSVWFCVLYFVPFLFFLLQSVFVAPPEFILFFIKIIIIAVVFTLFLLSLKEVSPFYVTAYAGTHCPLSFILHNNIYGVLNLLRLLAI